MKPTLQSETFEQLSSSNPPWAWENWRHHDIFPPPWFRDSWPHQDLLPIYPPFVPPPVPEPSILWTLLAGLVVVIAIFRNKMRDN